MVFNTWRYVPDVCRKKWGSKFWRSISSTDGGGLVYWGLWELDEGDLAMEHRPHKRLRGGGLGEGFITGEPERWDFWEICNIPCKRASLSIDALLGNWRGFVCRDFWDLDSFLWPRGHWDFKSEWGLSLTDTYTSGFLLFGPRGYHETKYRAIWNFVKGTGLL